MAAQPTHTLANVDRRAFSRFPGPAVPWLTVSTARSSAAEILDISDAGALIELPTRLKPGEREVVLLTGRDTIKVVGWAERVEITRLAPAVSYRTAFRFACPVELGELGSVPEIDRSEPATVEPRMLTGASRELVERFARWVRELSGVHALRVASASASHPGTEPVYFTVPASSFGNGRKLQVFFNSGAVPSAEEFAQLRRLAQLASDLPDLDIAPAIRVSDSGLHDWLGRF
jgi:hypothetical protein